MSRNPSVMSRGRGMTQRERFRGLVLLGFLIPLALELVGVLQAVAGLLGFP